MQFNCSLAHDEGSDITDHPSHQGSPTIKSTETLIEPIAPIATSPKIRNLKCPCCNRKFVAALDVMRHLDSGRCASGVTHFQIYNLTHYVSNQIYDYFTCPNNACPRRIFKFSSFVQHIAHNKHRMVIIKDEFIPRMTGEVLDALRGIVGPRTKKGSLKGKDLVALLSVW